MKNTLKFIPMVMALAIATGCSPMKEKSTSKQKSTTDKVSKNQDAPHVENELIFSGDPEVVKSYLKKNNLKFSLLPISKQRGIYQIHYRGPKDIKAIQADLASEVNYIHPNYLESLNTEMDSYKWPTDKHFFKQWALNNVGQNAPFGLPGERGKDMSVLDAWKKIGNRKNGRAVVVAVVDTGVDYTHEDLKNNMWVNTLEAEGEPGVDDDQNGLTDDIYGYDFTREGRETLHYGQLGDGDPMDESGHGTHCAGAIAAEAANGIGVVGVADAVNVQIMALRGLGTMGGNQADLARAIFYAVDKEADIISNSWGGGPPSEGIAEAISAASEKGILFVAAAGNDGSNNDESLVYPASYGTGFHNPERNFDNVISVGASDNQDAPALFSNYGHETVDVFAPGVLIVSTYPMHKSKENPYVIMSGTSMAAPYVSGVAALMIGNNPSLKGQAKTIKDILIGTSDPAPKLLGKSISNGRVNALAAIEANGSERRVNPEWIDRSYAYNQKGFNQELFDVRHTIEVPEAESIRVHFDFVEIVEPYDSIYVYDKNKRLISHVEATSTRDYWSATVPGDSVTVRYANSIVRQIQMKFTGMSSESACLGDGGIPRGIDESGDVRCEVHSKESTMSKDSSGGSDDFNTFRSQGFSIDRIQYVAKSETDEVNSPELEGTENE